MKITKYKVDFGYFLKITKMYIFFHRAYPNHFYLSLYPSCETHGQLSIFRLKFSWWGCWRLKRLIPFTNNFKTKFLDFFFIDKYLLAISMIFRILMRIRWVVYCPSSLLLDGLHKNFKRYTFFWAFEHPPSPDKNMELCTTNSQYREKAPISAAGSCGFSEKINFNDNSH